ncbi:gluconate 2-dehydrogenase subunit 3 family protein [Microvirga sp. VF16]|uniref:gluconate 2-dehydrogenase subunit 3 family protein n=1 Tax=Microvirga sp. VF16 TaxID=2807101 RepID=UPI00193CA9ED|nr:gluconate 2-dehydrogenase subunit 3 family protein [Microvirga sp. VF16]
MRSEIVKKEPGYIFNNCTKYLARDNSEPRHNYFGVFDGQRRALISEAWRFPVIDAHSPASAAETDAYEYNDVTFIYVAPDDEASSVELVASCASLTQPVRLNRVGNSIYFAVTLKVHKAERHRYRFIVDGSSVLDPINPQIETLPTGDVWSRFFTWAYNEPISFERWEFTLLDRLTRHILQFNSDEAKNFQARGNNEKNVANLYRLDISVGVANYIDKLVAREERHQLGAYKTCLEMLAEVLRRRHPGQDIETLKEEEFGKLYDEMADGNLVKNIINDGWDPNRYNNPSYFLYLLRRHAWTGAFSHPKYGGNPGGMAWAYMQETYKTNDNKSVTAFDWRRAIEPPLGTSTEYKG